MDLVPACETYGPGLETSSVELAAAVVAKLVSST
jgi:hypothetical protein